MIIDDGSIPVVAVDESAAGVYKGSLDSNSSQAYIADLLARVAVLEDECTRWRGNWAAGTYAKGDQVLDREWLCVALTETTDRPSPQNAGSSVFVYDGTDPVSSITGKQVVVGQRYTLDTDTSAVGFSLYQVTDNSYRVFAVLDPLGDAVPIEIYPQFTATTTGREEFVIEPKYMVAGTVFDLYVATEEPDPSPSVWTANYNYTTPNNQTVPVAGDIVQASKELATIRINKIDDDIVDNGVALLALAAGDVINGVGMRWAIQATPTDEGTYVEFTVTPGQQGSPDGVAVFTFETVVATPIAVVVDTDYWLTNTGVSGRYRIDGGAWVDTEDQYSIDIELQPITLSPDWGLQANSG